MDANKKEKLSNINYVVRRCCLNCSYGLFKSDDWGICSKFSYYHLKHSESGRHLSIIKSGYCSQHNWSPTWVSQASHYGEFLEKI